MCVQIQYWAPKGPFLKNSEKYIIYCVFLPFLRNLWWKHVRRDIFNQ